MSRIIEMEDQTLYKVSITTNIGLERTFGIMDVLLRSPHGLIFVYDVSSRKSFLAFERWREVRFPFFHCLFSFLSLFILISYLLLLLIFSLLLIVCILI